MTPKLARLYLRSRLAVVALAALAAVAALTWLFLYRSGNPDLTRLLLIVMPLGAAVVVGVSTRSPFGEVERTASFPLPALRLSHLAGLVAVAALALAAANQAEPAPATAWVLARNAVGYAGLALVGARFLGAGIGWLLPVAYGTGAYIVLLRLEPQDLDAWWLWPVQASTDGSALVVALALLVAGLALVSPSGARDEPGEAPDEGMSSRPWS